MCYFWNKIIKFFTKIECVWFQSYLLNFHLLYQTSPFFPILFFLCREYHRVPTWTLYCFYSSLIIFQIWFLVSICSLQMTLNCLSRCINQMTWCKLNCLNLNISKCRVECLLFLLCIFCIICFINFLFVKYVLIFGRWTITTKNKTRKKRKSIIKPFIFPKSLLNFIITRIV